MADATAIEWADSTFSPWIGCTKVGPGCDHCYAEAMMDKRLGRVEWGAGKARVRTSAANWRQPVKWNRADGVKLRAWEGFKAQYPGLSDTELEANGFVKPRRRRVFCASLADVFDNDVPIEWLVDLLQLIGTTPHLDWQLLTKRIGNWRARIDAATHAALMGESTRETGRWLASEWQRGNPPANLWLGATICNQQEADRDIPKLLRVPAAVRFLSIEPMLGPIDLTIDGLVCLPCRNADRMTMCPETGAYECCSKCDYTGIGDDWGIDWVICGGESGPHARPMHPDWARSLRDQCAAAGVPFMLKQWGSWAPYDRGTVDSRSLVTPGAFDEPMGHFGKKLAGRLLDGREHNGFPVVPRE